MALRFITLVSAESQKLLLTCTHSIITVETTLDAYHISTVRFYGAKYMEH
jgi:hypothetical protein